MSQDGSMHQPNGNHGIGNAANSDLHQKALSACHLAASTIQTSFNDAELAPIIEVVRNKASFRSLQGRSVVIVDDTQQILRSAVPILVAATEGKATFIHVDPYRTVQPEEVIKRVVDSAAEWVLLDAMLGQTFDGPFLARKIGQQLPSARCVGFSSARNAFEGSPVVGSILKDTGNMLASLERFANFVGKERQVSPPTVLIAISILCEAIVLSRQEPASLKSKGIVESMVTRITSPQVQKSFEGVEPWKQVFAGATAGSYEDALRAEVINPQELPTCFLVMRGIDAGTLESVSLEMVKKMLAEVEVVLGHRSRF